MENSITTEFSIDIERWENTDYGVPEVAKTTAEIAMNCDGWILTRAHDDRSKSVRNTVLLSAYPLALWLAASWWRLRWESASDSSYIKSGPWRMAHELAAAGYGFIWPSVAFVSDGEIVDIQSRPSDFSPAEPLRYLSGFRANISVATFENVIDDFVSTVLGRLDAMGIPDSDLHTLWRELGEERSDKNLSFKRQLESRAGYDPDEAPENLMKELMVLSQRAGEKAIGEIANGTAGGDPLAIIGMVEEVSHLSGEPGKIEHPNGVSRGFTTAIWSTETPWNRGRNLAREARDTWGLNGAPVSNGTLSDILGIRGQALKNPDPSPADRMPMGIAIREGETERLKFLFQRSHPQSRRFEAARFLGDWLMENTSNHWFPATKAGTARQKVQRAFAAEFLCPIDQLKQFLNDDYSEYAIEAAGMQYDVSNWTIISHLVNHQVISRDEISW